MKTKNLTPFPFAKKLTSRQKRRLEMTAIVRATYVLAPGKALALPEGPGLVAQGPMTADTYRDDDAERAGECLYPGDFADWKPNAEVMLRGTCHTPGGKPLTECPVRFAVGRWSKTLRIVGRRMWSDDTRTAAMSNPVPFTEMPVDYAHAFGGPEYGANPPGTGAVGSRELPNVEHAGAPIRERRDDPGPAGFGPINPAWPQRAGKVGKLYGARWRKERFPFYAEDFDWTYFHAAPLDQRLERFLRGDESVVVQNMHPTAPILETQLPGLRVRVFIKDVEGRFREVPMNLDTLFVDLDAGKLCLTWRGLDAIKTDDMKDVLWGLVASEKLDEAPLPEAHYRARLEKFEADPLEVRDRVPADLLDKFEEMKEREAARAEGRPVSHHDEPAPDPMTANLRTLFDKMPVSLPNAKEIEKSVASAVAQAMAGPKIPANAQVSLPPIDIKGQIASAANDMAAALAKPKIPAFPLRPGGTPPAWAQKNLQQALDKLEESKTRLSAQKLPAAAPKEVAQKLEEEMKKATAEIDKQIETFKTEPFFKSILERPAYQDPGPGKDLHGQDYEERDLHGQDLRGANLTDANLAGANLVGANLSGAKLEGAILCQADLSDAELTGADLTLANLTSARAPRAIFQDVTLTRAFLQKADLKGAVFRGAKGDFVFFPEADFSGADAQGISLFRSFGRKANLAKADFSGASLVRCLLLEVSAAGVKLSRAVLTRTSFSKGDLTGANVTWATGERSIWMEAKLHDADFSHASLPYALVMQASAKRAVFRRAVLKESRCYRTSFEDADFSESQLFGIQFAKCSFARARFTRACLYGARFRQASGGSCDFSGANLNHAMLEDA